MCQDFLLFLFLSQLWKHSFFQLDTFETSEEHSVKENLHGLVIVGQKGKMDWL